MAAELVCVATDRDAWLAARRTGVTATDIVTILGLNPNASEYSLYWEKRGELPAWEGNARTRLGSFLESYVLEQLQADLQWKPALFGGVNGLWRSRERAWQLATPDRVPLDDAGNPAAAAEVKTWADADRASWADGQMPARVCAQVLWQMDTLGVSTGHVGVLFLPSGEFESRVVTTGPDDEHEQNQADLLYMRQAGKDFWDRVAEGRPPCPDGHPASLAAVKRLHSSVCAGQTEIPRDLWADYLKAREYMAAAKSAVIEAEAALRDQLAGSEVGTVGGTPVVRRTRYSVPAKTIERKAYEVDKLTRLGARNGDGDE